MPKRILIIQAHPDASRPHLAHSLAAAYANGAEGAAHSVRQVVLATPDLPLLRSQQEWEKGSVPIGLTGDMKPKDAAKCLAKLERLGAQAL